MTCRLDVPTLRILPSTIQLWRDLHGDMSPRVNWLIVFALLPVLASGRGGGRGGHGSHSHGGSYSHGHSTGHSYGQQHTYPSGGGYSGHNNPSHTYPSGTGMSGHNNNRPTYTHKTEVHHHYHPPQQVQYGNTYHPVYHGSPPVYVYTYRDSGSRYNDLLTGLALYNLGRMSSHHDSHYYSQAQTYKSPPGEYCEFQIIKTNGEYEKAKMDCQLMSSFILERDRELEQNSNRVPLNTNTVTTVVNTTKVEHSADNSSTVVTTVQESTTVKDALQEKGPPIQVSPGMDCFMVRHYRDSSHTIKKKVDCGLLKQYAASSFRGDSARVGPVINLVILLYSVVYFLI
ncbi:hypothetical protein O0L34_g337 [Tuta absoluta]|nr:hypothetical protein O0L34_g337 [Tuta absoluta]